jgi:uncharacterized integral membrane protein
MFLKLLARVLALLIVVPVLWLVSTKLLGWSYPFWSWYAPAFILGFIGSFAIDGIVWLWRHLTMRAADWRVRRRINDDGSQPANR